MVEGGRSSGFIGEDGVFADEEHKGGEFWLGQWYGRVGAIFMEEGG